MHMILLKLRMLLFKKRALSTNETTQTWQLHLEEFKEMHIYHHNIQLKVDQRPHIKMW